MFGPKTKLKSHEKLAIGFGDKNDLSIKELRKFCEFVYPLEAKCGYHLDRERLKHEAEQYLLRAQAADLLRNFQKLPHANIQMIEARVKECSVDIANIDQTLKNLLTFIKKSSED